MPIILDASICASWYLPDEQSIGIDILINDDAIAPAVWWFEIRNILITGERRGRITALQVKEALSHLDDLQVEIDRSPNEQRLMSLARVHGLTAYDAAYLELALRRTLPLATLDRALRSAAKIESVAIIGE